MEGGGRKKEGRRINQRGKRGNVMAGWMRKEEGEIRLEEGEGARRRGSR